MSEPSISSEVIQARVPVVLAIAARTQAAATGMTQAEYFRHALRVATGVYRDPHLPPAEIVGDQELRRRAAFGNHLALRELVDRMVCRVISETDEGAQRELLAGSLIYAGLAAEHGCAIDQGNLAALMDGRAKLARQHGDDELANGLECEAMARLNIAADRGDAASESALLQIVEGSQPYLISAARARSIQIEENL